MTNIKDIPFEAKAMKEFTDEHEQFVPTNKSMEENIEQCIIHTVKCSAISGQHATTFTSEYADYIEKHRQEYVDLGFGVEFNYNLNFKLAIMYW